MINKKIKYSILNAQKNLKENICYLTPNILSGINEMPEATYVKFTVYDSNGRQVVKLIDGYMKAGHNNQNFRTKDAEGQPLA